MSRRALFLLSLVLLALPSRGQTPYAEIISYEGRFTLQSAQSGVYKVSAEVLVNSEEGLVQAAPVIYSDYFHSIVSFSAEVESAGRKQKYGKKDLNTVSISEGLADDSYLSVWSPSGRYPLTVRYEYSVAYRNGVLRFPVFAPVECDNVMVRSASFSLDLPAGTEIISCASRVETLPPVERKGRIVHEWRVSGFQPIVYEDFMPPVRELEPTVYSAPRVFSYAGTIGSQSGWKECGLWLSGLQAETDSLPPETCRMLQDVTADCRTDFDKLRVLYRLLRDKTRYVAIELGTGKLKPIAAEDVDRNGFGDCKALSNYLQAMLKSVGVRSVYYPVSTRSKDMMPGFPSLGQMDHVMLAVPLKEYGDTVFVECTNPRVPLGYRHDRVAGHEILLVEEDGGKLVRVGDYPDSLSRRTHMTEVALAADGSAYVKVRNRYFLDFAEKYFGWEGFKQEKRMKMLTSGLKLHPEDVRIDAVSDNFEGYVPGRQFCPEKVIDYSFRTLRYARVEGNRLFVPMNPVNKGLLTQKGARVNDIVIPEGYTVSDTIRVSIPDGYAVESLPAPVSVDSPWAEFRSSAKHDDGTVSVVQSLRFKPCRSAPDTYPAFRDLARKVNRCYDATIVLTRN